MYNRCMKTGNDKSREYVQVVCTVGTELEAERIARAVVEQRLAACVQIIAPVQSIYWWRGAIERSTEWMCVMKTKWEKFEGLRRAIREQHTYETPEIIATPIVGGDEAYLAWIEEEVGGR